jgi:hypothetical protein
MPLQFVDEFVMGFVDDLSDDGRRLASIRAA